MATIQTLEDRLNSLERSLIQLQKNLTPVISKSDNTANKVNEITPQVFTSSAYIDDTEVIFKNMPEGILTTAVITNTGTYIPHTIKRSVNNIIINFDKLKEKAVVILSIQ